MTTKASPPAHQHSTTGTSGTVGVSTSLVGVGNSVNLANVKIKKELPTDEINDFAETAMNEVLGWYGYDNVDRLDLSTKASRLMIASLQNSNNNRNELLNGSKNNSIREDSTTPDHDSSREDDSKSPCSTKTNEKIEITCGWCHRIVPDSSPEFLRAPDGPRYCSEACFAQSRRASFKRAKQCDWCRHIRHAVSYVDFQDGASQLQFCSDKCLNQYKMQIFCKETQAHLDMNPHLKEKGCDSTNSANLITPDLWLKNCRSRSASPQTDGVGIGCGSGSRSPTPSINSAISITPITNVSCGTSNNSKLEQHRLGSVPSQQQQNHKPIISVAPVSKLMSKQHNVPSANSIIVTNRQSPKHASRKKRNIRLQNQSNVNNNNNSITSNNNNNISNNNSNNINNSNNKNGNSNNKNNNNSHSLLSPNNGSNLNKSKILLNSLSQSDRISKPQIASFPNVQDLRLNVPPISPIDRSQSAQSHHSSQSQHQQPQVPQIRANFPPHGYFASTGTNNFPQLPPRLPFPPPGTHLAPPPPPHLRAGMHPLPHPSLQNLIQSSPELTINPLSALVGTVPPVTVMVPYPIIIPLPIPIPIPLPITDFIKAAALNSKDIKPSYSQSKTSSARSQIDPNVSTIIDTDLDEDEDRNSKNLDPLEISIEKSYNDHDSNRISDSETQSDTVFSNINTKNSDESLIRDMDEPLDFTKAKIVKTTDLSKTRLQTSNNTQNLDDINDNDKTETVIQQIIPDDEDLSTEDNAKQKVPKFKITRLHTRRNNTNNANNSNSNNNNNNNDNNNNNNNNNSNNNNNHDSNVSGSSDSINQINMANLSQAKEECSRPLRKRKRVIDCDYNVRNPKDDDNNVNSSSPKLKK
ncbi:sine oculis-binding protein homolog A [Condylostylus longicornis]|uniref:sine oculis-binding protein homolog A n=1 Tax=Condylostylus longicornis TaxID=2530218 RepID=UPI00244DF59A|nr:sine oculis-binding protein homolog A [Condylostylus longicornis]